MNHGKCECCWWYYQIRGTTFKIEQGRIMEEMGSGICYMHSYSTLTKVLAKSYCPDYYNRKRMTMTLEQWLDAKNIPRPNIELVREELKT